MLLNTKNILVTGSNGQVGRFLTRKLREREIDFVGLDKTENIKSSNSKLLKIDLTKKKELENNKSHLAKFQMVIHLASTIDATNDVIKNGISSIDLNIKSTLNLLEFLPNLEFFCFASTYMVYDVPKTNPVSEEYTTRPVNVYGANKLITEKFLQVFSQQLNFDLTILRFMGIYGLESPYNPQAITNFIRHISENQSPILYGSGNVRRNHIYVDDAIESLLISLMKQKAGIFNIGGPDSPSNLDLVNFINKKMGKNIKPVLKKIDVESHDFIADISLANKKLGFIPRIKIDEGLSLAIERLLQKQK